MKSYQELQAEIFNQLEIDAKAGQASATFVEPRDDYANDPGLCLTSVAFLTPTLRQNITEKIIKPLRAADRRQYFFPPDSLHITTQNVKVVNHPPLFTKNDIARAQQIFTDITAKFHPFRLELKGLLELPVSISIRGYSEKTFGDFVLQLRTALKQAGIPDDKKYASDKIVFGNSTVCRFTREPNQEFKNKLRELKQVEMGEFVIDKIALITTNSVCHPKKTTIISIYKLSE